MTITKPQVTIVDSCFLPFGSRSASLGGERHGESPRCFDWTDRDTPGPIFFTDIRLSEIAQYKSRPGLKIAWLIEPSWKPAHYEIALRLANKFDYIVSHRIGYFPSHKFIFAPFGGSWIKPCDWGIKPKTRDISMIGTQKTRAPGHKLRHKTIAQFKDRFDVYGRGYAPIESKLTALEQYRFSVTIESECTRSWFTEKLIDCFSQGTVPVYCGTPNIGGFFDMRGMICVPEDYLDEFSVMLDLCTPELYEKMERYINLNYRLAKQYQCVEDYIYTSYPYLFGGVVYL